jgi:hypothetical protein
MKTLLAWIRAYCRRPEFPGPDVWDNDFAAKLRGVLASDVGRALSLSLTNAAIREAFRATQVVKSADYDAGYASGFRGAIAFIEALAASAPPKVDAQPEESEVQGAEESAIPTP